MSVLLATTIPPLGKAGFNTTTPVPGTNEGAVYVNQLHGTYYGATYGGGVSGVSNMYTASLAAFSIPKLAATTATGGLLNPASSGVNVELVATALQLIGVGTLAGYVWCINTAVGATLTTPGTIYSGVAAGPVGSKCTWYSAFTNVGTATIWDLLAATNNAAAYQGTAVCEKLHNGRRILAPGEMLMLYTTTNAATGSAFNAQLDWAEWPV